VGAIKGEGLAIELNDKIGGVVRNLEMPPSAFLISEKGRTD
jgi:hypothetical protein